MRSRSSPLLNWSILVWDAITSSIRRRVIKTKQPTLFICSMWKTESHTSRITCTQHKNPFIVCLSYRRYGGYSYFYMKITIYRHLLTECLMPLLLMVSECGTQTTSFDGDALTAHTQTKQHGTHSISSVVDDARATDENKNKNMKERKRKNDD